MTHAFYAASPPSVLAHFLRLLRTATLERMVQADLNGTEIDERILLESYLVRTPPMLFAAPKQPLL